MSQDKIIFLGTAGARMVVAKQIRASGGMWLSLDNTNLYIDPGPGALVKCMARKEKLDPRQLDGILLSHKHIDHSNDVNIMIEAMTEGGFKPKGVVFAPADALNVDPVILNYVREFVDDIQIIKEGQTYSIGNITFSSPIHHDHSDVETYGINFLSSKHTISYITDTKYFPELSQHYRGDVLIISVVRLKHSQYYHLCIDEARRIIEDVKPKATILTHFGMTMIQAKPWEVAERLSQEIGINIIAARDGMTFELD
ncbi:MAG: MBL fold metallo-hydrolase [Gemmatimonadota bacterium]|nr:MAG: MBL fold metallo-hydrolase [Gemmatimonadota bacterium]